MPKREFSPAADISEKLDTDQKRNNNKGSRRGETDSNGNQVPKRKRSERHFEPSRDGKAIAYKSRGHNRR